MSVAHIAKVLKNAKKEWDRRRAEEPFDALPSSVWHLMAERLIEANHAVLVCPVCAGAPEFEIAAMLRHLARLGQRT